MIFNTHPAFLVDARSPAPRQPRRSPDREDQAQPRPGERGAAAAAAGEAAGPPRREEACPARAPVKRRRPRRSSRTHRRLRDLPCRPGSPELLLSRSRGYSRGTLGAGRQSRLAPLTRAAALVLGHPRDPAGAVGGTRRAGSSARRARKRPALRDRDAALPHAHPGQTRCRPPRSCVAEEGYPGPERRAATAGGGCGASPRRGRDLRLASLSLSAPPSPCPPPRGAGNAAAATHRAGGTRVRGVLSSRSCRRPPHAAAMFRGHRACPAAAPGARGLPPHPCPPSARRSGGGTAGSCSTRGHLETPASPHGRHPRTRRHLRAPPASPHGRHPRTPRHPLTTAIPAILAPRRHPHTPGIPAPRRHLRPVTVPALYPDLRREDRGWRGLLRPGSGTAL